MATPSSTDPAREYRLIEQLELRIASADSGSKFEALLQKYLPALLLKLASENLQNRNLAIKVCQYVNQRLKIDESIQLPVEALCKTFGESQNAFVKQFGLTFIQQGLARLSQEEGIKSLPRVLRSSVKHGGLDRADEKMFAVSFGFLLDVLRHWQIPEQGSKNDVTLKEDFALSEAQASSVSSNLTQFLLFDPKAASPQNLSDNFRTVYEKHYSNRGGVVPNIAKFLSSSLFDDKQRLIPAVVLSVDANSEAASRADTMFKQCNFDFDTDDAVDVLFQLYDVAKPRLRTRVLVLLSRSRKSTLQSSKLLEIVEKELSANTAGLEGVRLRSAIFTYLTWAVQISQGLGSVAMEIQNSLKEYIELQGWPVPNDTGTAEADLRSRAYESIGLLAAGDNLKDTAAKKSTIDLISWLFTSLRCDTTTGVRHSIEEALSRIINFVTIEDDGDSQRLKELLLWNVLSDEGDEDPIFFFKTANSAKYPAVRFANKCFPFSDVDARLIDIVALNSKKREVFEEGTRGLDPYWHASNLRIAGDQASSVPEAPSLAGFLFRAFEPSGAISFTESPPSTGATALSGAVGFSRNLIAWNAWVQSAHAVGADPDWKSRIGALLENDQEARSLFRKYLNQINLDARTRLMKGSLVGLAAGSPESASVALQLFSMVENKFLRTVEDDSFAKCEIAINKTGVRYQACRIVGIVASLSASCELRVQSRLSQCANWRQAIGQEVEIIVGHLLEATFILSRCSLRRSHLSLESHTGRLWNVAVEIIEKASDKQLRDTAFEVIAELGICLPPDRLADVQTFHVFDLLMKDAKKENEGAVSALGALLNFKFSSLCESDKLQIVDRVFELHEVRRTEFHFTLGRALSVASLGFNSSCTMADLDVDAPFPEWGLHKDLFELLLSRLCEESRTTKPSLKKAVGIWMLSLVQFCHDNDLVKLRLRDCQAAFSRLLTDRDEIVQETGSRGLGVVYEKGDKNLRDDLVRDLVQSFTGSTAKMSGSVNEDTQLFEPGALPTEGGQSVTTYKDIVSLAQEMGDPSLVYRFMNLASSNAIWSSRAAFGRFGLSGVLADSSYLKENKKFYPKLFRYRFDPNPNVQRSMDDIWKALVKDPNAVIEENFDLIIEDLLKSIVSGKDWRAREASCAAISDLVQGRDIDKLEKHLNEIWKVAFKVLDDVKETVRVAAMKLCRTLTAMLTRNLEIGQGNTKRATTMLNHAIPFLMQQMEGGAAKDVQTYAIATLLDLVKKAPAKAIQPFAPLILESLISSLSSLEHESINYLHLNADKYGLTAEKLDKMRVSSISASPMTEAIEHCLESLATEQSVGPDAMDGVETKPLEDAMRRLEGAFKTTIGLPSKVGLSRVMITLVLRHQTMFRPYVDRFVRLTRKSLLDRNATVSVSFSMALGYLLRLASDKEIKQTSQYAQKLYFESQELAHRSVAGELIQSVGKVSSDVFMNYATTFLPFAFIGRQDLEADVRERFDLAWKEHVGGSRALNLYLKEIVDLTSIHIKSSLWPVRHACCFAVADLVSSIEVGQQYSKADARLLWPLVEEALSGKTWAGKEKVISAFPKFVGKAATLWEDQRTQMKNIAIREAKRNNAEYRPHAVSALADFVTVMQDLDLSGEIVSLLTHVIDELLDDDKMELDDKNASGASARLLDSTLESAVKCMFASLRPQTGADVLEPAIELIQRACNQRSGGILTAVYEGARKQLEKVDIKGAESKTEEAASNLEITAPSSAYERFWQTFVAACLAADPERHAESPENVRRARVDVARSLAQSGISNQETRGTLATVFDMWLRNERSRPLRTVIEQAAESNKSLLGASSQPAG